MVELEIKDWISIASIVASLVTATCTALFFYIFQSIINKVELARVDIDDADALEALIEKCDKHSVLVVEGIWRNWDYWHRIEQDARTSVTFDLYYCGIVFFDKSRYKHNYKINF